MAVMGLHVFQLTLLVLASASAYALVLSPNAVSTASDDLKGKTLRVVTVSNTPIYTGFYNDLLNALGTELKFNSTVEVLDAYGSKDCDGQWNGMVGALVNRTADIAIADLTITPARHEAIDFTIPYLETGYSILAKKDDVVGMTSVVDIANQDRIKMTSIRGGSFLNCLRKSDVPALQVIYQKMMAANATDSDYFVTSNTEGMQRVRNGGVAMFMPQLAVRHVRNSYCNLTQLGGLLNEMSYGIGLQKDSPYTELFSQTIMKLEDEGKINQLLDKNFVPWCDL